MPGRSPPSPKSSTFDKPVYIIWYPRSGPLPVAHIARGAHHTLCSKVVGSDVKHVDTLPAEFVLCAHCKTKQERRNARLVGETRNRHVRLTFNANFFVEPGSPDPDAKDLTRALEATLKAFMQERGGYVVDVGSGVLKTRVLSPR